MIDVQRFWWEVVRFLYAAQEHWIQEEMHRAAASRGFNR